MEAYVFMADYIAYSVLSGLCPFSEKSAIVFVGTLELFIALTNTFPYPRCSLEFSDLFKKRS